MSNASSRFFWNDWAADPGLRACSLAAQGMWMRMLCLAAESQPPGYVVINGRPPSAEELGRICGTTAQVARKLIQELAQNGVSSRTAEGVIFNRRMVRESEVSAKRSEAGTKGGRTTWSGGVGVAEYPILPWQNHSKDDSKDDSKQDGKLDSKPDGKPESFAIPFAIPGSGSDSGVQNPEDILDSGVTGPARAGARGTRPAGTQTSTQKTLRSMRGVGSPNWSDPAVRKTAWEMRAFNIVARALPEEEAQSLIVGYMEGRADAKATLERLVWAAKQRGES